LPTIDAATYVRHLEARLGAEIQGRIRAEALADQYAAERDAALAQIADAGPPARVTGVDS